MHSPSVLASVAEKYEIGVLDESAKETATGITGSATPPLPVSSDIPTITLDSLGLKPGPEPAWNSGK